jgi:hypothetical protein
MEFFFCLSIFHFRNTLCSLEINWAKSVLGLNISLENQSDASLRRPGIRFQVHSLVQKKNFTVPKCICKHFVYVPVSSSCATQRYAEGCRIVAQYELTEHRALFRIALCD